MYVLSPALTVTRSFVHQATGKHTLLLTSKAYSRGSKGFPEKATKPKCPRVIYLCLTSPCRNPSSSLTLVRACVDRLVYTRRQCCICVHNCKHTCSFSVEWMKWNVLSSCFVDVSSCVLCVSVQNEMFFHMEDHMLLVHMLLNRPHPIREPSLDFPTIP